VQAVDTPPQVLANSVFTAWRDIFDDSRLLSGVMFGTLVHAVLPAHALHVLLANVLPQQQLAVDKTKVE
jgi:hypothetical protein